MSPPILFIFLWIYLAKRKSPNSLSLLLGWRHHLICHGLSLILVLLVSQLTALRSHLKTISWIGQAPKSPSLMVEFRTFYQNFKCVCEKSKLFIRQCFSVTCLWEFWVPFELCSFTWLDFSGSLKVCFCFFFFLSLSNQESRWSFFGCPVTGESKLVSAWQQYVET